MRTCWLLALLLAYTTAPLQAQPLAERVESKGGVVACVSPLAAEVGVAILKKGGNAVDAAVAVGLTEAVTWPEAGNIGGGGFLMLARPGHEPVCIDYREVAPAGAKVDLLADGTVTFLDHKAAGVPGTVRGFGLAHQKYGKLSWKEVVLPAVKLAEEGFVVNAVLATGLNRVLADPKTTNVEFKRVYGKPDGSKWQAGDTLILKDLGRTLRTIAEQGAEAFYTGEPARLLAEEMKAAGGLISRDDLAHYQAKERKTIATSYRGYMVYGPPPPSSGGICLAEMLNMLETFDLKKLGRDNPESVHLMIEAMKRAYADRARYLGDPDFVAIPAELTTKEYAKKLAAGINRARATPSEKIAPEIVLDQESNSTTHYSIVDRDGMAVSNTYTLENSYGNRVVVRGAGYLLNNQMTDFNPKPGHTTRGGQIGTKPNLIEPGKRMLSSMSPVIVERDGKVVLVTGSPGGRTIINTVLCIVLNVIDFDLPVDEAVAAPRLHHQWFPDVVRIEGVKQRVELVAKLKAMDYKVTDEARQGDGHSIAIDPKTGLRIGAADKRIDGKAVGE